MVCPPLWSCPLAHRNSELSACLTQLLSVHNPHLLENQWIINSESFHRNQEPCSFWLLTTGKTLVTGQVSQFVEGCRCQSLLTSLLRSESRWMFCATFLLNHPLKTWSWEVAGKLDTFFYLKHLEIMRWKDFCFLEWLKCKVCFQLFVVFDDTKLNELREACHVFEPLLENSHFQRTRKRPESFDLRISWMCSLLSCIFS